MKTKILLILAIMAMSLGVTAQTPYTFNYQSVVRDAGGLLLVNKNVGVQITILQGSVTGATEYQETFSLNTNDFALINLQVGSGTVVSGDMSTIDWSNGPYFMEVAMDFTGGNSYVTMGATQLVSVPYALHAKTAENTFSGDYNDLANSPTNVSSFTNDAGYLMMELDGDSTNELQALSLSNDTLYLSNGGYVVLPDTFDGQYSSLTGAPTNVSAFTNDSGYLTVEQDSSVTNEIQILTLVYDTIFLTNGGFVKLPPPIFGFDGRYVSLTGKPTNVSFFTNDAGYLTTEVDGDSTNEIQTLTFSNDSLHLSSGGDVDLSGYDNSAAIATNTANITMNTNDVLANTVLISSNFTSISGNTTSITTNTGNIATNTSGIATNVTDIGTNTTNITTNTSGIATNAAAISTNSSSITANTTSITANTGNIATNTSGIATNVTDIGTNTTNITTNTSGIATNAAAISTNSSSITANTTNITTNTGNIATNTSGIATNITDIGTNTTNIATNTTGIATNATSISNHITADLDVDSTNEIQTLSLAGTTLNISGANSVDLQNASVWDTNTVGALYSGKIGIGGTPVSYKGITIHTDSLGVNGNGLLQYGKSNAFNYFELKDRDNGKRVSIGMADTGSFKSAFTVGTNGGSGWTDPMIVAIGAPNNSFRMLESGNVGFGVANPDTRIHAVSDSTVILGISLGSSVFDWQNSGLEGIAQTTNNAGRGVYGNVYGANWGYGVRGEASTDGVNYGVSGIALSSASNANSQYGVYGEAVKGWGESSPGTGNHFGGFFIAEGAGSFNVASYARATSTNASNNRGVEGLANSNTAAQNIGTIGFAAGSISGTNTGAFGQASNSTGTNYGVHGVATGTTGTNSTGVYGYSNGNTIYNTGVDGTTESTGETNIGVGGYAYGTNTGSNKNYGVYAYAQNADTNYGLYSTLTGTNLTNYGAYSTTGGGTANNYAVYATTDGEAAGDNVGVYAESVGNKTTDQNVGVNAYAEGNGNENQGLYAHTDGTGTLNLGALAVSEGTGGTSTYNYGLFGRANGGTSGNYGLYGTTSDALGNSFGVYGRSNGTSSITNWAVRGHALGANGTNSQNAGVTGSTNGSATWNLGILGQANGSSGQNYGVYGWAANGTSNYAGYFDGDVTITGNLNVTGSIAKGSGTFKIDHPLDPENKYLVHSFMESPDMMNVYSGNITTDANGYATVDLPSYFEAANKDFRYQLTVIGSFAQAIIKNKIADNKFVIQTNTPNIEVSWQVSGVRSDKYADAHRVIPELEKEQKGTYLHPELYGVSEDKSEHAKNKIENAKDEDSEEQQQQQQQQPTSVTSSTTTPSSNTSSVQKMLEIKKKSSNVSPSPIPERNNDQASNSQKEEKKAENGNEKETPRKQVAVSQSRK